MLNDIKENKYSYFFLFFFVFCSIVLWVFAFKLGRIHNIGFNLLFIINVFFAFVIFLIINTHHKSLHKSCSAGVLTNFGLIRCLSYPFLSTGVLFLSMGFSDTMNYVKIVKPAFSVEEKAFMMSDGVISLDFSNKFIRDFPRKIELFNSSYFKKLNVDYCCGVVKSFKLEFEQVKLVIKSSSATLDFYNNNPLVSEKDIKKEYENKILTIVANHLSFLDDSEIAELSGLVIRWKYDIDSPYLPLFKDIYVRFLSESERSDLPYPVKVITVI